MNDEDANYIVIRTLAYQLRLAVNYMRDHVTGGSPLMFIGGKSVFDHEFLLDFADGCEEVLNSTTVPNIVERYEALVNLYSAVGPFMNLLLATGNRDSFFEERIMKNLKELHSSDLDARKSP